MGIKQKNKYLFNFYQKAYLRNTQRLFVCMYFANPTQCAISVIKALTTKKRSFSKIDNSVQQWVKK